MEVNLHFAVQKQNKKNLSPNKSLNYRLGDPGRFTTYIHTYIHTCTRMSSLSRIESQRSAHLGAVLTLSGSNIQHIQRVRSLHPENGTESQSELFILKNGAEYHSTHTKLKQNKTTKTADENAPLPTLV